MNKIRIGSRGSDLALWQAHFAQDALTEAGFESEIIIISTKGDQIQHLSFDKIEGKGFFTKEIEDALLNDKIDVAIHSHKDLETQTPTGLCIAGVSYREDPSELLLIHPSAKDVSKPLGFKEGAVVGTSSARRKAQISALRPDITIKDIRGNVPTRIEKLRSGDFDAILLANAGVSRLKLNVDDLSPARLDPKLFIPAPAQGVLAYQCREEDEATINAIQKLHNQGVKNAIQIERSILSGFGGGCHIPIGAYAEPTGDGFDVRVSFAKKWEDFSIRVRFQAESLDQALSIFEEKRTQALPKTLFVSRNLSGHDYLARGCEALGIKTVAKPLIEIEAIPFDQPSFDQIEWVFFSSSNAVDNFFSQVDGASIEGLKFGAIGSGTAVTLGKHVPQVDFQGSSSDIQHVGADFAAAIGKSKVLFPMAEGSLSTVQSFLNQGQVENLVCYRSNQKLESIDASDAYVFTSPSNVRSFFQASNSIPAGSAVVAIGKATARALNEAGVEPRVASIPHDSELLALIAS